MAIIIKTNEEIEKMRVAGHVTYLVFEHIEPLIKPGITTGEIDKAIENFIRANGGVPSFLNYAPHGNPPYPASSCISVNEEVTHGIPGKRKLREGDIVSVDVGALVDGFHGDATRTFPVGNVSEEAQLLMDVAKQSFFEGIKYAKEGHHLHEISAAIQDYVEKFGFSVVRDFIGHGIGRALHEAPEIPHYKMPNRGPRLSRGMVLAIEPMINVGTYRVNILKDSWTAVTADRKLSAQYENTVLVTDGEPEILTV